MTATTTPALRNVLTALAIATGATCAPAATAQDSGFYLGMALGKAGHGKEATLGVAPNRKLTGIAHGDDFSWQFIGGYRFNRYVSVEASYLDLGAIDSVMGDPSGDTDATANVRFDAAGPTLALIGTYPMGRWEPYLKAGVLFSDTQLSWSGLEAGKPFGATLEGSSEDPIYGIGLGYDISDRWQLKLDATLVYDAGEERTGHANFTVLSGGVTVRF